MKKIIDQQLFITIKDFFSEILNKEEINPNELANFLSELKEQEVFLNNQGLYEEADFLECIDYNFERTGLYNMFSSDKAEAKKIIQEIFSNKTKFSSDNVRAIESHIGQFYQEDNVDNLMKMGAKIIEEEDNNRFQGASKIVQDLSSKVEAHKVKEGLGVILSAVLNDDNKKGQKAIKRGTGEFFNFVNDSVIGNNEPVFFYDSNRDEVDVNLCSHKTVFDAFLRNDDGAYTLLIATNSHDSKMERDTAFTHPISALHIVDALESKLLPLKEGNFESIADKISHQQEKNEAQILDMKGYISNWINEYARVKEEMGLSIKDSETQKGQIRVKKDNNSMLNMLLDDIKYSDKPGPRLNLATHMKKQGEWLYLSREMSKRYLDKIEDKINDATYEQEQLLQEQEDVSLLVKNRFVDFSGETENKFISDNLSLLKEFVPVSLKEQAQKTQTFGSLVKLLDKNTNTLLEEMDLNVSKDEYGNLVLGKKNVEALSDKFEQHNLTVRFYGRIQGKKNHAYLSQDKKEEATKEAVNYTLSNYTFSDYLVGGKNGVKMDFEGSCAYIENVLLKNTITETTVKNNRKEEQQVLEHEKINDPKYTRNILKNILNDYVFNADKERVIEVFNKNTHSKESLDNVTLGYISSITESFWSDFSNKIDSGMSKKDINEMYFEVCGNLGIKVERPFEEVLKDQIEINNSANNNKARNSATIASLNTVSEVVKNVDINSFIAEKGVQKEQEEVRKMMEMGMSKENIQEIKPEFDWSSMEGKSKGRNNRNTIN